MVHLVKILKADGSATYKYTYGTEHYEYDITKLTSGYSVQIGGDELVFYTTLDAEFAMEKDIAHCIWENAPILDGSPHSLDKMIEFINESSSRKEWFREHLFNKMDWRDIDEVLTQGYSEYFGHYGPEVKEGFIKTCKDILIDFFDE